MGRRVIPFLLIVALLLSFFSPASLAWRVAVSYESKYLSPAERAAVDESLSFITSHRMQNVSLRIVDDAGLRYTGPVQVTQDSTSFIFIVGSPWHFTAGGWKLAEEYFNFTTSRSYYVWAPWKEVERIRGVFDFSVADYHYKIGNEHGMADFHVEVGPYLTGGQTAAWNTLPDWAKSLDYDSLKASMRRYVEALVSNFKGKIQYYHLWTEANGYYGNGGRPIQQIVDIIQMEALVIRAIDPDANICIDLDNITQQSLNLLQGNSWTTEDFVKRLVSEDVPFDVIGLEPHYGSGEAFRAGGMDTLYHRLIELGRFGKPVYIWEDGPASFIEPKYFTDQGWWAPRYLWHGVPSEEKQAEYMVAETIVALGNPSVIGLRFNWLHDYLSDALFYHRFNGVIQENGTRKKSYAALEELWNNLRINLTMDSNNGTAFFRGLAGSYTLSAQGYETVKVHVPEGPAEGPLTVTLVHEKSPEYYDTLASVNLAHQALMNLTEVQSQEAKNLTQDATSEYELATASLNRWELDAARLHAERSTQLAEEAVRAESRYSEQLRSDQLQRNIQLSIVAVVAIVIGPIAVFLIRNRSRKRDTSSKGPLT